VAAGAVTVYGLLSPQPSQGTSAVSYRLSLTYPGLRPPWPCRQRLMLWANPFTPLGAPELFNLRTDPYERADITSNTYWEWMLDRAFLVIYGQAIASQFLETFKEFPPRQKAATFTIDQALKELEPFLEKRGD
jgi:hypothetical protein